MRVADQQVHTNSINKSIVRLLDAAGFHIFVVIHGQRYALREKQKEKKK